MNGTIKKLRADRGYGFIRVSDGPDIFMHVRDCQLDGEDFTERLIERQVEFETTTTEKGTRAKNVRLVSAWVR